jgi:hypothetical protein
MTAKTPRVLKAKEEEECVPVIAEMLQGQRIIRVDGHSGMGKSRIAKAFAKAYGWARIESDAFLFDPRPGGLYYNQIDKDAFAVAAQRGLECAPGVVLDGICLDYILPPQKLGPEFRVYMLSVLDPCFAADEARRRRKLGTDAYHADIGPKEKADLVVWKRARF